MPSALTAIARMNVSFVETGQLLQPWQQVCRLTEWNRAVGTVVVGQHEVHVLLERPTRSRHSATSASASHRTPSDPLLLARRCPPRSWNPSLPGVACGLPLSVFGLLKERLEQELVYHRALESRFGAVRGTAVGA